MYNYYEYKNKTTATGPVLVRSVVRTRGTYLCCSCTIVFYKGMTVVYYEYKNKARLTDFAAPSRIGPVNADLNVGAPRHQLHL